MNVSRMGRRLATAGFASALAAGALVGASTTAADAATGTSTYTCTFPVIGATQVPVATTIPDISSAFPAIPAGLPLDAGSLPAGFVFDADPTLAALLPQVTGLAAGDMSLLLGDNVVPVGDLTFGAPTTTPTGHVTLPATAANDAFSVPGAGVYQLTMPKTFTLTGTSAMGPVSAPCTTATPAVLDTLTVVKNDSFTTVKAPATVKKGSAAKIVAAVAGGANTATGKVVFKDGTKTLGSKSLGSTGKAVFKATGLKVGKHTITAKYVGDSFRNASAGKAIVKVVR